MRQPGQQRGAPAVAAVAAANAPVGAAVVSGVVRAWQAADGSVAPLLLLRATCPGCCRARELRDLLSGSGPALVKIGQALSSRPDLLPQVRRAAPCSLQQRTSSRTGSRFCKCAAAYTLVAAVCCLLHRCTLMRCRSCRTACPAFPTKSPGACGAAARPNPLHALLLPVCMRWRLCSPLQLHSSACCMLLPPVPPPGL